MTPLWWAIVVAAIGCYLLKLAGVSLPESILNHPKVQRVAQFLPIAMLSALVAVELFDHGGRYALDWRTLAGVTAGVIALLLRRLPGGVPGSHRGDRTIAAAHLTGPAAETKAVAPRRRGQGKNPAAPE